MNNRLVQSGIPAKSADKERPQINLLLLQQIPLSQAPGSTKGAWSPTLLKVYLARRWGAWRFEMKGFDKCKAIRLWLYFTRDGKDGKCQGPAKSFSINPFPYLRPNLSTICIIEVQVYMEGTLRYSLSTWTLNVPKTSELWDDVHK